MFVLDVYTWEPNANSGKPLLMLKEKGAEFRYHYIDMGKREQHTPRYLALNPDGTVPTIVHDGHVLTESSPALEYLDAALAGPRFRPHEPYMLWRMRWWIRFLDSYFCPALAMFGGAAASIRMPLRGREEVERQVRNIPLPERRRAWRLILGKQISDDELAESERRIHDGLARFETALEEHAYLSGPEYGLADIVALMSVYALPTYRPESVNEAKTPRFMDWLRRMHARPAVLAAFALSHGWVGQRVKATRQLLGLT
jgi:GSH-dependent disulfide-bond oxidoreductase